MNSLFRTTASLRWLLVIASCFILGWGAGQVDRNVVQSVKALLAETYLNKFNAMSGANIDEYVYYVISDDASALEQLVDRGGISRVEATALPTVFNTYIAAAARREMLSYLRGMSSVTAVFTVPFMCH